MPNRNMRISHKYSNADAAVIILLKQLGSKINPKDVISELEKHPDHPSMLAISDVLSWFKISNAAYRINAEDVAGIPTPFIAHTYPNNDFVIVSKIDKEEATLSDDKRSTYKLSLDKFKKRFKGVVLTAEATGANTHTQNWPDQLMSYKLPAVVLVLGILFIATLVYHSSYFLNLSWQILLLTLFKTAGLITSILLLVQSIDKNNPLVQTLCGGDSKTNCNAILLSNAATVFKGLSWSEVGFFYFTGTLLSLLFGSGSVALLQILALLNIASLPYTIYSINYQARIAKQWCVLCCAVQAILWLEFIPLITSVKTELIVPGSGEWSILFICMLLPVILWGILKPLLVKSQQLKWVKQEFGKLKYNIELFDQLLKKQAKYTLPNEDWSILLGNVEANNIITMVTNPYCPPCSSAHKVLDEWLNYRDDLHVRVVFVGNNSEDDIKTPVIRHLMALNELPDKTIIKNALHDWYEQKQKNYAAWANVHPVRFNEANYYKIDKQKDWCQIAEISATPTLLLNGYRLPDLYNLPDLKYMLY